MLNCVPDCQVGPWSSGYHFSRLRQRSRVRFSVETFFFLHATAAKPTSSKMCTLLSLSLCTCLYVDNDIIEYSFSGSIHTEELAEEVITIKLSSSSLSIP